MPVTLHLWPAPQPRVAGGGAFLPQGLSSPPTPGLGLQTPRAAGQRSGKAAHWLCQDFTAQSWLLARLPRLLGKGPCSLPQALHVGPPAAHPGESRYSRTSCLAPDPPWSPALGPGAGPSLPTNGFLCRLSPPPAQVRGPGGACLVTGLHPDHKVRDRPGISGEMLLAKPRWLQGPDRKPPSRPCGFPAPTTTDPRAGVWDSPASEVSSQTTRSSLTPGKCVHILGGAAPGSGSVMSEPPGFECWG